jgi:hypothetical protein
MAGAVSNIEVHLLWVVDGSPKDPPPALCKLYHRTTLSYRTAVHPTV